MENDQGLPTATGDGEQLPPSLTSRQNELCKRLDELHAKYGLKTKPSDMFRGAIFAIRAEFRNNPDWIAQAANSLRDILYPFGDGGVPNKEEALRQFGSVRTDQKFTRELGRIFGTLTQLAHHGNGQGNIDYATFTPEAFEQLFSDFERIMLDVLMRQIDIHQEIDKVLAVGPENSHIQPVPIISELQP